MTSLIDLTHSEFLQSVYATLDESFISHGGGSVVKGFWQSGLFINVTPDKSEDALISRDKGFWRGTANTVYGRIELLIAIFGGNVRVGFLISETAFDGNFRLKDEVSCLYDGKPANAERLVGTMRFFDWIFKDDPFSAQWLAKCSSDQVYFDIFKNHLLWLVIHLWEGLSRIILANYGDALPVFAHEYIPSDLAEKLSLIITDRFPYNVGTENYKVTLIKTEGGVISDNLKKLLKKKLTGCVFELSFKDSDDEQIGFM